MDANEFINVQNKKYLDCCTNLMYFYLKSSNEIISIEDVLNNMTGDKHENKAILHRIIKSLNKHIYFGKVKLSYNDYLKLGNIVKKEKSYTWQLVPYIVSICAILITCFSFFFGYLTFVSPIFIYFVILLILIIMLYFICRVVR